MSNLFDLTGKVAIVTGSTKGIGKAIAAAYAHHGAKVVITSRDAGRCEATRAKLAARGDVVAIPANATRKAELEALVAGTRKAFGRIDVVVCNAAVNPYYGPSLAMPDAPFEKVMNANILANIWLVQMVADEMKARRDGAIILMSSIGGAFGTDVIGAYAVSKAAVRQVARNLAVELGPDNIRVNCIAPGLVKTDFARALWEDPDYVEPRLRRTPLRRLGEPEDIAGAAVFLASPAASWMTGQTITIDGGATVVV
ncbi:MAG: SDR family oxidoreductase [Alphaproteobacteria bacterium]|nr:SDR family oxidoreductase [Alphaproteobacteria bacterium]